MDALLILKDMEERIRQEDCFGWDLYDALLSKWFKKGSILDHKYPRYVWSQVNKRFPFNLRKVMSVPKSHNPKGLALILRGYCELYKLTLDNTYLEYAYRVLDLLLSLRSEAEHYCWGYNFPYQSRGNYHEAFCPNAITTSFAINAIVDLYKITKDSELLEVIDSVRSYIVEELLLMNEGDIAVFNYYVKDKHITYNATAKVTESLAKIYDATKDENLEVLIRGGFNYVLRKQNKDGSWFYDDSPKGDWIDNFHTGYILVALLKAKQIMGFDYGDEEIQKGFDFHLKKQYTPDMIPRYYIQSLYPIDTHCFAQSIITFSEFNRLDLARRSLERAIELMYDSENKYFIYSIRKYYTIKTNLLRWCNAYMFYAMALLLYKQKIKQSDTSDG
jgi:uncharacterized protein YyaL (SSP411 family)